MLAFEEMAVTGLVERRAVARAMFLTPRGHQTKDWAEALTMSSERILNARRHLGVDLAMDHVVALQFAQLLRKHFLSRSRKESLQFTETANVPLKVVKDGRLPLSADDVGGDGNGAIEWVHLESLLELGTKKVPTS